MVFLKSWGTTGDEDGDCYPDGWAARKEKQEKLKALAHKTDMYSEQEQDYWLASEGLPPLKHTPSHLFLQGLTNLQIVMFKLPKTEMSAYDQAQVATKYQLGLLQKIGAIKPTKKPFYRLP